MKTFQSCFLMVTVLILSVSCHSQNKAGSLPKYVSEKGYWVVETNVKDKKNHLIWFYNNQNEVVYRESVKGVRLNTARKKVRMKLKNVLDAAVTAWERSHRLAYPQDQGLVKTQF